MSVAHLVLVRCNHATLACHLDRSDCIRRAFASRRASGLPLLVRCVLPFPRVSRAFRMAGCTIAPPIGHRRLARAYGLWSFGFSRMPALGEVHSGHHIPCACTTYMVSGVLVCMAPRFNSLASAMNACTALHLTNRWSQPLAARMSRFDLMKQFPMLRKLAAATGGSAPSR